MNAPIRDLHALMFGALTILFAGCAAESVQLTVRPPEGTTRMELVIVQGACPTTQSLASGHFRCAASVLHTDVLEAGELATMVPPIEGPHAIIAVASVGGCGLQVACAAQGGPADANILNFTDVGSECGGLRACSEGEVCEFTSCETIPSALDADGDGITNGFECCGPACLEEEDVFVNECADSDGDDEPDYLDDNSDDDGYLDSEECFGDEGDADFCDHDGDAIPDFQNAAAPNEAGDFDGDGITDSQECTTFAVGEISCPDSDCDGVPDSHELDSDDDGTPDSEECSCGEGPCSCPDTDDDGIPDVRDPLERVCSCAIERGPAPGGECSMDSQGTYCGQLSFGGASEIEGTSQLRWLSATDDEPIDPAVIPDLSDLSELSVPHAARRFPPGRSCTRGGVSAAIGELSNGMMLRGYIIDLRGPGAEALLPSGISITPRSGRFVYSPEGVVIGMF